MKTVIPKYIRPFLWSYNIEKIEIERDKKIIIKNVLDYGTKEAIKWLLITYSRDDISKVIITSPVSDWGRKSLALWSLVFGVVPKNKNRVFVK